MAQPKDNYMTSQIKTLDRKKLLPKNLVQEGKINNYILIENLTFFIMNIFK